MKFFASIVLLLTISAAMPAQQKSPQEQLRAAAALARLDTPGLQPWHMKLDIHIFGRNPQQGTAEIWSANGNMRTVETFDNKQVTILRKDGKLLVSGEDTAANIETNWLIEQILDPVPEIVFARPAKLKLHKDHFGTTKLNCIEVTWPTLIDGEFDARIPAFCLGEDSDRLRVTYGYGVGVYIRPRPGEFQGKEVPLQLEFLRGNIETLEADVKQLTTYTPDSADFAPSEQMHPVVQPVQLKGEGAMLLNEVPAYPTLEMLDHPLSGAAELKIVFGEDGHVLSLQPEHKSDSELLQCIEASGRQWILQPYSMNGIPVRVEMGDLMSINMDLKDVAKKFPAQP